MKIELSLAHVAFLRKKAVEEIDFRLGETQMAFEVLKALEAAGPAASPHAERLTAGMSEAGQAGVSSAMTTPPEQRPCAPWPDYSGRPIYEGDVLQHQDGPGGVVVRLEGPAYDEADRWRVRYHGDPENLSRLGLQIGDKGRAVVVRQSRQPLPWGDASGTTLHEGDKVEHDILGVGEVFLVPGGIPVWAVRFASPLAPFYIDSSKSAARFRILKP